MNTRLKQFLSAENISQSQFADTIKVVRASVSHVLAGRNNPSYDFIKAIMDNYPSLNIEWLIFGKGKMYKDPESPKAEPQDEGQLFPIYESESSLRIPEILHEDILPVSEPATTEINSLDNIIQPIKGQRKVSKIIVLFDDGTFQEM